MKLPLKLTSCSFTCITFLIALYFVVVVNIPVYAAFFDIFSELEHVKIGFIISIPIFFLAAFNFLFNLFSWPWLTKPFFAILILVSAAVSYASFNYGILLDSDMIANIVETDSSEAGSYLSLYSVAWIVGMGVIPALIILFAPISKPTSWVSLIFKKMVSMVASVVVIGLVVLLFYQDYASVGRNNSYLKQLIIPTQLLYSIGKYTNKTYLSTPLVYKELGLDAKQTPESLAVAKSKPTLMVFVLGETARAENYELNGYPRPTNQYTKSFDMISFQDVSSCGTATAVSVPCMFSSLTRDDFDRQVADNQDNFLDILQRAEIDLLWIENDGGDKKVAKNIPKINVDRNRVDEVCDGKTCFDAVMLEDFEHRIDSMSGNRMLFTHIIGSHGPTYYKRYPKAMGQFQPDCQRSDIENCSVEQIVNTYDNTILYTDFIMAQIIERLEKLKDKYNTALFYISDHGESLGENGMFLHGFPYSLAPSEQTRVPMMLWMSEGFEEAKSLDRNCMQDHAQTKTYSQDNLFHSMLGIMDVKTQDYEADLDLFKKCRSLTTSW